MYFKVHSALLGESGKDGRVGERWRSEHDSSCGDGRTKSRFESYFGSSICRILSNEWTVGPFIKVVEPGRGHDLSGGWEAQALLLLELAVGPPDRKMGRQLRLTGMVRAADVTLGASRLFSCQGIGGGHPAHSPGGSAMEGSKGPITADVQGSLAEVSPSCGKGEASLRELE